MRPMAVPEDTVEPVVRERSVDPIMGSTRERRRAQFELLRTLLHRELRGRYRDSALGSAWTIIQPVAMTTVYYFLFSWLLPNQGIPNYALFILTGIIIWNFYANCLTMGSGAILGSSDLVRKVWFRRELLPMAVVIANAATTTVLLAVVLTINVLATDGSLWPALLAPVFFVLLVVLCFGLACLLATATVFFRDVGHLVGVLLMPLFFMTPVFYALESFPQRPPEWVISLLRYGNPVTPYIESIRAVTMQGQIPGWAMLAYCAVVAPAIALLGVWVLRRKDDKFAVEL